MFDFLNLKNPLSPSSPANGDDVMGMKQSLVELGPASNGKPYYDQDQWGLSPWPNSGLFDGVKSFQKDNGLKVDGEAKHGLETETAINRNLMQKHQTVGLLNQHLAQKADTPKPASPTTPAQTPGKPKGPSGAGGQGSILNPPKPDTSGLKGKTTKEKADMLIGAAKQNNDQVLSRKDAEMIVNNGDEDIANVLEMIRLKNPSLFKQMMNGLFSSVTSAMPQKEQPVYTKPVKGGIKG